MDDRIELLEGCRRTYHLPGYGRFSLRLLNLAGDARDLLMQVLQLLDQVYPDDPFIEREGQIMVFDWYDHPDLQDPQDMLYPPGIKVLYVETLHVSIVFWEGKARMTDGRTYLYVLDYLGKSPDEFTDAEKKRLPGLAVNVAMKYDALL